MQPNNQLRTIAVRIAAVLTVALGGVAFASAAARGDSSIAVAGAAPQQDVTLETSSDLGGGFVANIDATTVTLSHECSADQNVATRTQWALASYLIEVVEKVGGGADNPLPIKVDLGRIYQFTCAELVNGNNYPVASFSKCVAFSELDGVVTTTLNICPTTSNEALRAELGNDTSFGPPFLFPSRLGAAEPLIGMEVSVSPRCEAGDTVALSLDGKELWTGQANGMNDGKVALPQLSGEHRLTTACLYDAPATPRPAQRGDCLTFTVTDTSVVDLKECNEQAGAKPGEFGLRSDLPTDASLEGVKTTVVGGCGGYGFATYTTTADGTVIASAAVARPNDGDVADLKVTARPDSVGFFVGTCWTDLAGSVPTPLVCYHVVGATPDEYALGNIVTCPFSEIKTAPTS